MVPILVLNIPPETKYSVAAVGIESSLAPMEDINKWDTLQPTGKIDLDYFVDNEQAYRHVISLCSL